MSWRLSTNDWRVITDVFLLFALWNVVVARPPQGMPFAPSVDPFAPPSANYGPQYAPQYGPQPPSPGGNAFSMPQQPPPTGMNYNQQQQQYMAPPNPAPVYPAINQVPPRDAAPVGATAPGTSSQGEMEFESGQGGNGGGWGNGASSNYIYPPNYSQNYGAQGGQYGPPSLLDAYYQTPYQQGQSYYQYQMNQRNRNDIFGGMFGSTPSGNMFGALMLNEFVF